jgi:hypothetical protein
MCTAPTSASMRAGQILAWDHAIVGQSIITGTPFEPFMVKNGVDAPWSKAWAGRMRCR